LPTARSGSVNTSNQIPGTPESTRKGDRRPTPPLTEGDSGFSGAGPCRRRSQALEPVAASVGPDAAHSSMSRDSHCRPRPEKRALFTMETNRPGSSKDLCRLDITAEWRPPSRDKRRSFLKFSYGILRLAYRQELRKPNILTRRFDRWTDLSMRVFPRTGAGWWPKILEFRS
jgi:hypothetical protein